MSQYVILTRNPKAGRPDWHGEVGIAFNSRSSALNSMNGTIECLRRAGDKMEGREWIVVAIDWHSMIPERFGFWARLKWSAQFVFNRLAHKGQYDPA